jgi:hypothetical protein
MFPNFLSRIDFKIFKIILGFSLCFFASALTFSTIPVIDWASLAKEAEEIKALGDQLTLAKSQLTSITGLTDLGKWKNAEADLENREWTPADWNSALNLDSSGHSARFNQLLAEYQAAHPNFSPENISTYQKGASKALSSMFTEQVHHDQLSQSMASGAYAEVNQDFKDLHDLGLQIGNASDDQDLKHAVDLNSRVQLEVGNLAVQQIRMLALLNQQMAQSQSTALEEQQDASAYLSQDVRS